MDVALTLAIQRFPLEHFVAAFSPRREGKEWFIRCPKCGLEKLSVSFQRRLWRCFICGPANFELLPPGHQTFAGSGGVFQLVKWMGELSSQAAAQYILEAAKIQPADGQLSLPDPGFAQSKPWERQPTGLPENCVPVTEVLPYMVRRGISLEDARQFGLGYVPPQAGGWLANRLVFPVWEKGQCICWQARACWDASEHKPAWDGDKFKKSMNPSAERGGVRYFASSDVLLNLEQAATFPRVIITEGPTSCIRAGPSAVATFGKHLSSSQVARLIKFGVKAVDFMWDGPSEKEPQGAWPEMIQAAAMLAPHMEVRMVFLPQGDPGEYARDQLLAFCEQGRLYQGPDWRL